MLDFPKLIYLLKNHNNFIITSHVNPDPDAIGSEVAMGIILRQLNKKYKIVNSSTTPYNIKFLDASEIVEKYDSNIHDKQINDFDAAIFLDLNSPNRTARMEKFFDEFKGTKICIDHHTNPSDFTEHLFVDETKSSTGEILFDLISCCEELELTDEIAIPIYAAIMTDTGSFRYSKTNSTLLQKVSKLLKKNISTEKVYDKIYSEYRFSRNQLLGEALSTIKITQSGKVSYIIITQESLKKTGALESDVDGFVNYTLTTIGVEVGILFFELKDGIKISFRSKGSIPVNLLAEKFNGGGHRNASGSRLFNTTLNDMMPKVLGEAEKLV